MESLRSLNIICNGNNLGKYSENFCLAPGGKTTGPSEICFFDFSPLNSLNLVLIPGAKSNGHRDTWTGCVNTFEKSELISL